MDSRYPMFTVPCPNLFIPGFIYLFIYLSIYFRLSLYVGSGEVAFLGKIFRPRRKKSKINE